MPETLVAHQLRLEVDLEIEVGHSRDGHAVARMTGDGDGLVLDVDEPLVLLRSTPAVACAVTCSRAYRMTC
ncbi:MAG: hypothetical protein ACR2KJ_16220 [Jatrophihabitans sp.]